MRVSYVTLLCFAASLTACVDPYASTPTPDYSIHVQTLSQGKTAIPPTCANWVTDRSDPYDNQPIPQFGCATARNLALMVDRPEDLITGRDSGDAHAATSINAIKNYESGSTRGLIDPGADASQVAVTTAPSTSSSAASSSSSGGGGSSSTSTGP